MIEFIFHIQLLERLENYIAGIIRNKNLPILTGTKDILEAVAPCIEPESVLMELLVERKF
jgi:hypothetical protein